MKNEWLMMDRKKDGKKVEVLIAYILLILLFSYFFLSFHDKYDIGDLGNVLLIGSSRNSSALFVRNVTVQHTLMTGIKVDIF